jgi:hypothetical protein
MKTLFNALKEGEFGGVMIGRADIKLVIDMLDHVETTSDNDQFIVNTACFALENLRWQMDSLKDALKMLNSMCINNDEDYFDSRQHKQVCNALAMSELPS